MSRGKDETTEAYHERLAAAAKPSFLRRVRDALRADAALHDITDTQFMNGEDPLRPDTTAAGIYQRAVKDTAG